jgi:hypothetical protein
MYWQAQFTSPPQGSVWGHDAKNETPRLSRSIAATTRLDRISREPSIPDNAMNRLSPVGSYIVIDRGERSASEGLSYLAILDGVVMFRRWFAHPERAETFLSDPAFKIEYLSAGRSWLIIGRVRRTLLDI